MKKKLLVLFFLCPVLTMAQGHKGSVEECAPVKNNKICYTDEVEMEGMTQTELFRAIHTWATKTYGKDVFLSNVSSREKKGTILISSKVELLLEETDKTRLKYKMNIACSDGKYTVELSHITYQYDAEKNNRYKTYKAEEILAGNGKNNTVSAVKDPVLFCNATFFFAQSLFADIVSAAGND